MKAALKGSPSSQAAQALKFAAPKAAAVKVKERSDLAFSHSKTKYFIFLLKFIQ
jgi:hypothetical protein